MSRILAAGFVLLVACSESERAPQTCSAVRIRGTLYYKPAHGPPIEITRTLDGVRVLLPASSYTGAETEWETPERIVEAAAEEVECIAPSQ